MNDKEKAVAYLHKMQANAKLHGGKSPLGLPHAPMIEETIGEEYNRYMFKKFLDAGVDKDIIQEFLKEREDNYHRLKENFSPQENPTAISILGFLQNAIRQSCSILDLKFPENVVIGTLPNGKIKASANPVPESTYKFIVVDEGIFTLINLFAKLINYTCKGGEDNPIDIPLLHIKRITKYIDREEDISNKFVDVLLAYLIKGNPNFAEQYFEKESDHKYSDLFRTTAELFILGHEYGHIFYNHHEKQKIVDEKLKDGSLKIEKWKLDWYKEQMADEFAIYIILGYNYRLNKHSITDSIIGIVFFFSLIQILEEALSIRLTNTHPDAASRINNMHQFLVDTLKPRRNETGLIKYIYYRMQYNVKVGFALRASARINSIMMYLWNKNKEQILMQINAVKTGQP